MNQYSFYLFVGMMVMFLAFQYISTSLMDQRQNVKARRNSDDHNNSSNDNGPGGDGVY